MISGPMLWLLLGVGPARGATSTHRHLRSTPQPRLARIGTGAVLARWPHVRNTRNTDQRRAHAQSHTVFYPGIGSPPQAARCRHSPVPAQSASSRLGRVAAVTPHHHTRQSVPSAPLGSSVGPRATHARPFPSCVRLLVSTNRRAYAGSAEPHTTQLPRPAAGNMANRQACATSLHTAGRRPQAASSTSGCAASPPRNHRTSGNQRVNRRMPTLPSWTGAKHRPPWRVVTDTETSMLPEVFRKRHVRSKIR